MENTHLFRLGFIGGGVMAEALLSRLLSQQIYSPNDILVSDISPKRLGELQSRYCIEVTDSNSRVAQEADVLLLAIKPQAFDAVTATLEVPCCGAISDFDSGWDAADSTRVGFC